MSLVILFIIGKIGDRLVLFLNILNKFETVKCVYEIIDFTPLRNP